MWDVKTYERFASERARPFFDLLSRIPSIQPRTVADLGCGTGALTHILSERWPDARVTGVDSSAEMLARAWPLAVPGRLEFVQADAAEWAPDAAYDVIVSNAALQWLPGHQRLLDRLLGFLRPGGVLAVQMPDRFRGPSQEAIDAIAADPRWADRLAGAGLHRDSVLPLERYVRLLLDVGCAVDAWRTTYVHVLTGPDPVLRWLEGTALRPLAGHLSGSEAEAFRQEVGRRLRELYPSDGGTTLFLMDRLFFVAVRPTSLASEPPIA